MKRLTKRQWRHLQDVAAAGAALLLHETPELRRLPAAELFDRYRLFLEASLVSLLGVPVPAADELVPSPSLN